jgi:hypothetical protein
MCWYRNNARTDRPQCIGDHEARCAPETLTATAHFYQWTRLVADFATILDKPDDAKFSEPATIRVRSSGNLSTVESREGRQGEQVFGLYHDLIPTSDLRRARDSQNDLSKDGALRRHFRTKYLLRF